MPDCHYCDRAFPFSDASKAQHVLNVQGKNHIRPCRNIRPEPIVLVTKAAKTRSKAKAPKKKAKR